MTPATLRYTTRHDLPALVDIEQACFPVPLTGADLSVMLARRHAVGLVAEVDYRVVAHAIFATDNRRVILETVAVMPGFRRHGIGRALVCKATSAVSWRRGRTHLEATVHERNDAAVRFLSACGLRAVGLERDCFPTGDDGYVFEWRKAAVLEPECVGK